MKLLLSLLLLPFSSLFLLGQNNTISGKVVEGTETLPGAHVFLVKMDSDLKREMVTDLDGTFKFDKLPRGEYGLKISYLGFEEYNKTVTISQRLTDLGMIQLTQSAITLGQVEVKGQLLPAQQKGDTTEFNAGAFKVNPDANAEDLVKKMPGVVMQDGQLQAQGENIREVLVDGKPFFGNDPAAALKNLPAEVIEKIQVFDQLSDQAQFSGVNDGNTSKTLNIITKPNMRAGQFGKIYGGYGYDDKYQAGGNINFFTKDKRISIIGLSNNINEQNFSSEDLVGALGGGSSRRGGPGGFQGGGPSGGRGPGGGGQRGGGGNSGDFLVNQQNGIVQTHAIGLNYSDKLGAKGDLSGSYFFNYSDNNSGELLNRQYIDPTSELDQFYTENSLTNTQNMNHRLNMRVEYNINEKNRLMVRPRFSLQKNNGDESTNGQNLLGSTLQNRTNYLFTPDLEGLNFSIPVFYSHRFAKAGRTFSINLNGGMNTQDGKSILSSQNDFFTGRIYSDTLNQLADLVSEGTSYSANVSYSEPIGKKGGALQLSYDISNQITDSNKETFDYQIEDEEFNLFNEPLSNTFKSQYLTHRAGAGYRYFKEGGLFFSAQMNYQQAQLQNDQQFPVLSDSKRTFENFVPTLNVRYNFNPSKRISFDYRTNTNPPSITQLQDVVDNSNPLQLRTGNPDLKQNYQHNLFFRYSNTNTAKSSVFYSFIGSTFTNNAIVNSTFIAAADSVLGSGVLLPRGATLIRPVNLSGNYSLRSFLVYGRPIKAIKSNVNLSLSASYQRQPGMANYQVNYSNSSNVGVGLTLSSNISTKVDFTISSRSNFNKTTNTLNPGQNANYFNQSSEVGLNLILGKGFVIRTSLNNQLYDGLSEDLDQNFWLLNAAIGQKFLKDNRGEIKLSVFDLLKQNISISRTIRETYIDDLQTQVLQQYFMLTFTYNLRHFGTPANNEEQRRPGGGPEFWRRF